VALHSQWMPALPSSNESLASSLARLPTPQRETFLSSLTEDEARVLKYEWRFWARPSQLPPPGDWRIWLILAGRGFGKTRTIVETVQERVERGLAKRIHIVARTAPDGRDVIVEGQSGFLGCATPWCRPIYEPTKRRLSWPNGARATLFSAEEPNLLRGPQCDTAIADELASWKYPDTWDQLMFGLRLGSDPRVFVATTPRPTKIIKELVARSGGDVAVTRGSTFDNRENLAPQFLSDIARRYEGTRLGRQELYAEILDDAPGALWKQGQIEGLRVARAPDLRRIVIGVDPAVTANEDSDETGIVVAGVGKDGHGYVLADGTMSKATPNQWAGQVAALYRKHGADRVVAEVNNGGDLVEVNLRTVNANLPVTKVRASRGKQVRAEPIAALYEQGKVHHVGLLAQLEDQMTTWDPAFSTKSPDRVDALVWALSELMLGGAGWEPLRAGPSMY
jgi:phage terminase large subunit-like protein